MSSYQGKIKARRGESSQLSATTKAITIISLLLASLSTLEPVRAVEPDKSAGSTNSASQAASRRERSERRRLNEDPSPPERHGSEIFTDETPSALLLQAKQFMRHHNYNKALKLLKRAIQLNDDDMDIRVLYAEALDEKLSHQAEKEPDTFNECVKSWLMVARQEVGLEKGMTFKGLGFMSGQYADEDWAGKAKKRLRVLTGYSPKLWETDDRYLKKVLKPAETSVSAVIKSADYDDHGKPVKNEK
jgi:tetratricopeptide (TPR) repeat protein